MAFIHATAQLIASRKHLPEIPRPRASGRRRLRFARLDRLSQLSLSTAAAAMARAAEAGAPKPEDETEAGAALGTAFGAHLSNEQFMAGLLAEGQTGASPALFPYTLPSTAVGELSVHLMLRGPLITLAQGPGSGMAALAAASEQVDQGRAAWMLAGAADTLGETLELAATGRAPDLSEGAVFFVLTGESQGARGQVAGWASATGADAVERAARQVDAPADVITLRGGGQVCGAQVPLLALARHLASDEERPLRLLWDHGDESASALLVRPCPSRRSSTAAS